jgi:hypothetical protein
MTSEGMLIVELAKAKENIRQKYSALKLGDAEATTIVSRTLKPIIDPLENISTIQLTNQQVSTELKYEDVEFLENPDIENWFHFQAKDKTYGPKKLPNGIIQLGNKIIKFIGNTLVIDGVTHILTPGLVSLLFSKYPYHYTQQE